MRFHPGTHRLLVCHVPRRLTLRSKMNQADFMTLKVLVQINASICYQISMVPIWFQCRRGKHRKTLEISDPFETDLSSTTWPPPPVKLIAPFVRFAKLKGRLSVLQHLHTPKPDNCESSCFLYRSSCRRTRSQLPETLACEFHMASLFNGTSSPCMLQTIEKIRPVNRKDDHHQVIDFYQNFCPACVPAVRHQDDTWIHMSRCCWL